MADPTRDGAPSNDPESGSSLKEGALSQEVRDEFKTRLDHLGKKLDRVRTVDKNDQHSDARGKGLAIAVRMGSEFVVAVLIGGAIGWFLDKNMGTTPFMLFVFLMLGFAAGTKNIIRAGKRLEKSGNAPRVDKNDTSGS